MSIDFENILKHLNEQEISIVKSSNIDSAIKLIPLLLKRVHPENVHILATIIKQSLLPSICEKTNEEIDKLFTQIDKEPNLLFDKKIQQKIEEFTTKRFERDKQVVIEKTSDISKLVVLMGEYLNEAISSNGSGSKNVLNIKEKIQTINIKENGIEALTKLQNELINAAASIGRVS